MGEKHPRRKKDKFNTYKLEIEYGCYYLSFIDGQNNMHKMKIDKELYDLFNNFELEDISYINQVSRHHEHSELSEETLNLRAFDKEESIENVVLSAIQNQELYDAIYKLPETQRRRLVLYYFDNLTYEQVAEKEGCTFQAVAKSIKTAEKRLKKLLNKG